MIEASDKSNIHMHESVIELTILSFLKTAVKKNTIDKEKQSEYLIYYFLVALIQFGFIMTMSFAIKNNHVDYKLYIASDLSLLLIKFVASVALHFMLYPEVGRTMVLLKYTNNHPEYFTHPRIVFMVAATAHNLNFAAEILNLFMLLYQHTVMHCIIHFVAFEIIVEIPHIYMGSLLDDKLKDQIF